MIFLLYGPDTYRRHQKTKHIITRYQAKHAGLSLNSFDLDDSNVDNITNLANFSQGQSLFEAVKLAVVTNPFSPSPTLTKDIYKSALNSTSTNLILISDKKPPTPLAFLLKAPANFEEFNLLIGPTLTKFIKSEANSRQLELSTTTINLIANSFSNTWEIINELDRLALSDSPTINSTKTYNFFYLFNQLTSPNPSHRFTALYMLKKQNEDMAKVFNLLAYQRNINRSLAASADTDIKSGRLDYPEAILNLLL